jgi:hypothetical protein
MSVNCYGLRNTSDHADARTVEPADIRNANESSLRANLVIQFPPNDPDNQKELRSITN